MVLPSQKRLTLDGTRWEMRPEFEPLLRGVLAAPARVIKESAPKIVTEQGVANQSFYIKRYRHEAVPLRSLKFFFKPSQARQEWRLAQALEERGVPIVRHAALGERWGRTGLLESILITEAFAGIPANEVTALPLAAVVAFIERIWRAGVVQRDLHPANLLVHPETFEMRLVDLHGIVLRETPVESDLDAMLAAAHMTLPIPVSPRVARLSLAMRKKLVHSRSRRCLKTNRDFARKIFGDWSWHVRTASVNPALETILRAPDDFLHTTAQAMKRGRSSTVGAAQGLVLKRYNFKKPHNLLKDLFRGSPARRGFRKAHHLELAGLATPRVLAAADPRVAGLPSRSYLLMEEIPAAVDAGQWAGAPRPAARALGELLARLHHEGFTHRDLKETNVLFNSAGTPHLIDLDGLEFVSEVSTAEAAANLERLARGLAAAGKLTRSNLITFLLAYGRRRHVRPRVLFPTRA